MTVEQACRALAHLTRVWLRGARATEDRIWALQVIVYHQRRNQAAIRSKQNRVVRARTRKKPKKAKAQKINGVYW